MAERATRGIFDLFRTINASGTAVVFATHDLELVERLCPTVHAMADGKIAHLDGLNLARAWCWRGIAPLLPADSNELAKKTADEHLVTAMPNITGDYMGEHWLATFALLALTSF